MNHLCSSINMELNQLNTRNSDNTVWLYFTVCTLSQACRMADRIELGMGSVESLSYRNGQASMILSPSPELKAKLFSFDGSKRDPNARAKVIAELNGFIKQFVDL